jgi:hypothetical protein
MRDKKREAQMWKTLTDRFNPEKKTSFSPLVKGTIDIDNRKILRNPDGSVSTESSISIGTDQGEVLIPTVINGVRVSEEEAIQHYRKTGEHLGIFKDIKSANEYADQLHNRQGRGHK